jgi:aconitate hydratase
MMRGTFANIRLRNELAPGTEGGFTTFQPGNEQMTIFEAATRYATTQTPLILIGGKEYGTGSSRDWAAKGPALLGVRVVLVESFERIHRSNLVGMGVLPLQFQVDDSRQSLGLTGTETFALVGLERGARELEVQVSCASGEASVFTAVVRIDTPKEWDYYLNGGILPFVIRQLLE